MRRRRLPSNKGKGYSVEVKWSLLTPEAIEELLMLFEASSLQLDAFAVKNEFSVSGFRKAALKHFPDRFRAVMRSKQRKSSPYQRGRAFEYRIMADLQRAGYSVMRASGSHGVMDIYAMREGSQLYVQAKISGVLPPDEREKLIRLAVSNRAVPVLAERSDGRTLRYWTFSPEKVPFVFPQDKSLFGSLK